MQNVQLDQDDDYERKIMQLQRFTLLPVLTVSDRVPLNLGIKSPEKSSERLRVKNNPTCGLLKLLLSVWKEDFGTPVPVQLIFSKKNIGYLAEVKQREVKLICGAASYLLWSDIFMSELCLPAVLTCVDEASAGFALLLAGIVPAGVEKERTRKRGLRTTCQCLIPIWGAVGKAQFNLGTNGKTAHLAWEIED